MIKVNTLENNVQEIRSSFEKFRKEVGSTLENLREINTLSYESFNSALSQNGINQYVANENGSLNLNAQKGASESNIANLAKTISKLGKYV